MLKRRRRQQNFVSSKTMKENAFLRMLKRKKNAKCSTIRQRHASTIALANMQKF